MSINKGTLIGAPIRPVDSNDLMATAMSNEVKGGLHSVSNINDRNAIILPRRDWGMLCYVSTENITYQLTYGYNDTNLSSNTNWKEWTGGNGNNEWVNSVISILLSEPVNKTGGDRYLVGTKSTDVITGDDWLLNQPGKIAEWDALNSKWLYTTPLNGMTVRVDGEDGALYNYVGNYDTGEWQKARENQVRYIGLTSSNGLNYTATSIPSFSTYDKETIFICNFNMANSGNVTVNINNVGALSLKANEGQSITEIATNGLTINYSYFMVYNGTFFELKYLNTSGSSTSANKYYISPTDTITVPAGSQYYLHGDLTIDGTLNNNGEVVVVNGSMTTGTTGVFNIDGAGTYSNLYFAEIDTLAIENYIPKWKDNYTLSATSSIIDYDDKVIISAPIEVDGFRMNINPVEGYVLTSDAGGTASWQLGIRKFNTLTSLTANIPTGLTHSLNTNDIICQFWDGTSPVILTVTQDDVNHITITSSADINNCRIVIIG